MNVNIYCNAVILASIKIYHFSFFDRQFATLLPLLFCTDRYVFVYAFIFSSKNSLFSFAEGSLFFYNNLFRQRAGLCPCWCKTTRNTCQSAVAYGSASWGVPSPASFEKLDQTLNGKSFDREYNTCFLRTLSCNFQNVKL